jgi:hypothetical protein
MFESTNVLQRWFRFLTADEVFSFLFFIGLPSSQSFWAEGLSFM